MNIVPAWKKYDAKSGKRQVIVALIDTGVDITHPELSGSIWTNTGEIPGDGIDNDGNGYIDDVYGWNFYDNNAQVFTGADDNHGTHSAGTMRRREMESERLDLRSGVCEDHGDQDAWNIVRCRNRQQRG